MRTKLCVACVAVAATLSIAACGSDDSSEEPGAATTPASADGGGVAEARDKVAALLEAPGPLDIPAVDAKPAAGKSAYWISCKFPECEAGDPGFEQAMKALGWKLETLKPDLTPEGYVGAWTQAVAAKPDAIFAVHPLPVEIIAAQLEQAEQQDIVVALAGAHAAIGQLGVDASIASTPSVEANGVALTDWAIADSDGKANIVYLYDESFPLHVEAYEAGKAEAEKLCPDCTVDSLTVQFNEAGKGVPGQVVSYLQKNPDVDYVLAVGASSLALGVGQAVKSAGVPAKVGSALSAPPNLDAVSRGLEAVAVPNELTSAAWRMSDAAVRLLEGQQLPDELAYPVGSRQILDETNIEGTDVTMPWDAPDVPGTFLKAWRVD